MSEPYYIEGNLEKGFKRILGGEFQGLQILTYDDSEEVQDSRIFVKIENNGSGQGDTYRSTFLNQTVIEVAFDFTLSVQAMISNESLSKWPIGSVISRIRYALQNISSINNFMKNAVVIWIYPAGLQRETDENTRGAVLSFQLTAAYQS